MNIHASCVVLARAGRPFHAPEDAGVLLLGPSGAGKSDLALRMIAAGAVLVADDRAELSVRDGSLAAAPPRRLAGLIEVRNVGIVALPYRDYARVVLAVDLTPGEAVERLPEPAHWVPPDESGLAEAAAVPLIRLNAFEISAPAKIAVTAAAFAHALLREDVAPM